MIVKCTRCRGYKNPYGVSCQPFYGEIGSELLFVGEMYGKKEVKAFVKGKPEPFVGDSGDILVDLLEQIGLKKTDVAITNSLKCYLEGNETPPQKLLDACFIHLLREIKKIKPKLIIALGASAFYSLIGKPRNMFRFYRGKLLWSDKVNAKVYILNHPAAQLYDPNKKEVMESDFLKIPEMINAEPFTVQHYQYTLVDTNDKFSWMYADLYNNEIKLDMEMTSLNPYDKDGEIRTLQLGNEVGIYVIPKDIIYENINRLKELIENNPIVGQDFTIDAKWLSVKLGIFPKNWKFDTCLAEYVISGMKDNDLNFITGKYNPDYYGYWEDLKEAGGAHKVQNKEVLYQYGADDIGTMIPIKEKQYKKLGRSDRLWLFENITMPSNKVLTKMSLRGVKIDLDNLWKIDALYEKKAQRALYKAQSLPGISECENHFMRKFNPKSSDMIKWLLLDYYNLPILKKNKDNKPMTSQKEMERYAQNFNNPYCKIMEKYRSIETIRGNFLKGVVPKLVGDIAHTSYSLHSTGSGRPNSKEPNLLNIPRLKEIKRNYIARDGYTFVYGDEKQLEVRLAGVVYNEPRLIEICNDLDKDIHSSITAKAFNKTYDEVYDAYNAGDFDMTELRVKGKTIQFGVIYQMGAGSLAYELNITKEKAKMFIDEYYQNFPDLKKNIEKLKEFVIENGYVDNYFNFRRTWRYHKEEDHGTLREAVNHVIQSLAWNLIQLALVQIDDKIVKRQMKSRLVLQMYDAICIEALDEEVEECINLMRYVLDNVNKPFDNINRVLLASDIEIGKNLADMERV